MDKRGDGPNEMGDNLIPVDLSSDRNAVAIEAGALHTCALLDDFSVKCWGFNSAGILGLGDVESRGDDPNEMGDNLPSVNLGIDRRAVSVRSSGVHTCALLDNASVKCWGRNEHGQIGVGDVEHRGDGPGEMGDFLSAIDFGIGRSALAISVGAFHACALLDDFSLKCWGRNLSGVLGLGDSDSRGDGLLEMGDNLPVVDLGTNRTGLKIAVGFSHTCALLDNGSVKCWGFNNGGQLGLGDDPFPRGDELGEMGDDLPEVGLGASRSAIGIASGDYHVCATLDDLTVKCWGRNEAGQLGLGDVLGRGDDAGEMDDNLPVVDIVN